MKKLLVSFALLLAGCAPADPGCGNVTEPYIVTGLNGLLNGTQPAVEIELRAADTCDVITTTWMFWDDATQSATLGDPPTDGTLGRQNIEAADDYIVFHDAGLAVHLEYPGGSIGPTVKLTWMGSGRDLSSVDCDGTSGTLMCSVTSP